MKFAKKVGILLCCLSMFFFGACTTATISAEQTYPLKIWKQNENGVFTTLCLVDEETGVNYIVVSGQNYNNKLNSTPTIAITPRLNSDGSLYTN